MLGLPPHIHLAFVGERVVMLDTRADRYALLTGEKAKVLIALRDGIEPQSDLAIVVLVAEGILSPVGRPVVAATVAEPARGALEVPGVAISAERWGRVFGVAVATLLRLRFSRLDRVLAWATRRGQWGRSISDEQLIALARHFDRARLHVPLRRVCLRDAIMLARLMTRRGIAGRLVLGVRLDPFGAHAWVQAGDLVMTGSLGTAREVTPILAL